MTGKIMNTSKDMEGNGCGLIYGTIPAVAWQD
jgi:hypothetical protein